MTCRGCGHHSTTPDHIFCDLGALPLVNKLLTSAEHAEVRYPHRPIICERCLLVQMPPLPPTEVFDDDYPFFSGVSPVWGAHCRKFADRIVAERNLGPLSRVLEIGSNDGAMLERFRGLGVPALGVEPCESVARHALMHGIATVVDFWGSQTAQKLRQTKGVSIGPDYRADLVIANNVLAHVPDVPDFLLGVHEILQFDGVVSIEVAYLGTTVTGLQFDQVYAEHYSYFSISSLCEALTLAGLIPLDVEMLSLHGGSIRLTAGLRGTPSERLQTALQTERESDWHSLEGLRGFGKEVNRQRIPLLRTVLDAAERGAVGYGASAKANLLLAWLGLSSNEIEFIADLTSAKWNKLTPGSRIPILGEQQLKERQPPVVINFLWNWPESDARIRAVCPDAEIVYLRPQVEATV